MKKTKQQKAWELLEATIIHEGVTAGKQPEEQPCPNCYGEQLEHWQKFTESDLMKLNPCRDVLEFAKSCNFDFAKIYDTCQRGDWMIWLLQKSKAIDKHQAALIACECAERVLFLYEKKHPKDLRPRQAIESARNWAKNPTEENRVKCKTASSAAAAYAAAYAAASSAADAYAAAAYAYAADACACARTTERKWQADKIRELIPNPYKLI